MKIKLKASLKNRWGGLDMKKELEQRSYNFEIRAEENENNSGLRTIIGRPIVYNSRTDIGYYDEIIETGALDSTDLTDVRFLVNHDLSRIPLARSRRNNANSTLRLMPDLEGMMIATDLDIENNMTSRELVSAVDRGDVSGMSFMFSVDEERWEDLESDHPTRHILKIGSIVEISAVTFPAYNSTEIYARSKAALDNARLSLENARKEMRNESVDTEKELELLKEKTRLLMNVR